MNHLNELRICTICVMDTSAEEIKFDIHGRCNFCSKAKKLLTRLNKNNDFEIWANTYLKSEKNIETSNSCVLGLSGGIDSSYLLHKLVKFGIKPLVLHVDCGWNSHQATGNINKLIETLGLKLETIVIKWPQIKSLQLAFLKSGIKNQDIPQDYIYFSSIYNFAEKYKISNIFLGSNYATESILPQSWGEVAIDYNMIKNILDQFGDRSHLDLIKISNWNLFLKTNIWKTFAVETPLNKFNYKKTVALKTLEENYNWFNYGGKHKESNFTKYFQEVYLPNRFGIIKEKAHISSLIINDEITRQEGLQLLNENKPTKIEVLNLRNKIATKLEISTEELENLEKLPLTYFKSNKIDLYKNFALKFLYKSINLKKR